MNFDNYLFRAHMVGRIIDVPKCLTPRQMQMYLDYSKRKSGEGRKLSDRQEKELISLQFRYNESNGYKLSDSTKKILSELTFAEKFKRKVEINSPKLTKGIEVEKSSRDILTRISGIFLTSCKERKSNNYVTGAIDIEPKDVIIDIKSSWSWTSFCKILQERPNDIYLRQGDSYMDLWQKKDFLLCHVLTDTPFDLVEKELRRLDYTNNIIDLEGNVRDDGVDEVKKLISNHIFSRQSLEEYCNYSSNVMLEWFDDFVEVPEKDRVHMIAHEFQKERIEQRNECIALARDYMNNATPINKCNVELIK